MFNDILFKDSSGLYSQDMENEFERDFVYQATFRMKQEHKLVKFFNGSEKINDFFKISKNFLKDNENTLTNVSFSFERIQQHQQQCFEKYQDFMYYYRDVYNIEQRKDYWTILKNNFKYQTLAFISMAFLLPPMVIFFKLPKEVAYIIPICFYNFSYLFMIYKYQNIDRCFLDIEVLKDNQREQERMDIYGECFPYFLNTIYQWQLQQRQRENFEKEFRLKDIEEFHQNKKYDDEQLILKNQISQKVHG